MPINVTRLFFVVAAAAVTIFGVYASAHAQDFSRAYRYGGGVNIPGAADVGSGVERSDIIDVNAGIDVGGVLGCSGIDLRSMIQNTFEVGNIGDEFKDYLKNTLATEALSLLYSQPGVSQVLDGMKAIGHARASILQERCNANEIMADVTNQRLRSEAYSACIQEKSPTECQGEDGLREYLERVSQSNRWSGDLHQHICPEGDGACAFIPNFTYDVGGGGGKEYPPQFDDEAIRDNARRAALECLQGRGEKVTMLVNEQGYAGAQAMIGAGEAKIFCGEGGPGNNTGGPDDNSNQDNEGGPGNNTGGPDDNSNQDNNEEDPVARAMAGLSAAESCVLESVQTDEDGNENPIQIDVSDLDQAMADAGGMDLNKIIEAHTECIIGKETHGHVDLNIVTAPAIEALAAWNGLAEVFAVKAFINLNAMRIRKLSQAIVNSGGRDSSRTCERDDEGNKVDEGCVDSMTSQKLDQATNLLEQFRDEQEAALAELEMAERVAERIDAMNREREERQVRGREAGSSIIAPNVLSSGSGRNIRPDLR